MARKRDIEVANMIGRSVGEKMDQVEDAIRRDGDKTRAEYKAAIGEVQHVVDIIIDDLSAKEKKELYDLNTVVDISELEETEKEFLVAVLFTLSNMTDYVSAHQQAYLRSVKAYLGIKNIQTEVDLSYIENIDSKRQTRAILQTVMEFLFLENCTHDYMDEYEDVLDYFDVKSSEIRKIEKNIDRIYTATGSVGLAKKYEIVSDLPQSIEYSLNTGKLLKTASSEKSLIYKYISLRTFSEIDDMFYGEDGIRSFYEIEKKAKITLMHIRNKAQDFFTTYSSMSLKHIAIEEIMNMISSDIIALRNELENLPEYIEQSNTQILGELKKMLSVDEIRDSIDALCTNEFSRHNYRLPDASSYYYKIEYSDSDCIDGFGAIFKQKNWYYDGMEAWSALNDDLSDLADSYFLNVSRSVQKNVLLPIANLIKRMDGVEISDTVQNTTQITNKDNDISIHE